MSRIRNELLAWLENRKREIAEDMAEVESLSKELQCGSTLLPGPPPITSMPSGRFNPEFGSLGSDTKEYSILRRILHLGTSLNPSTTRHLANVYSTGNYSQELRDMPTPKWFGDLSHDRRRDVIRIKLKAMREDPKNFPSLRWTRRTVVKHRGYEYLYWLEIPKQ